MDSSFFDKPCVELARAMLGCVLVCRGEAGEECRGEVVEVEAYLGPEDRAAHSYNGRRTAANEAMYMVQVMQPIRCLFLCVEALNTLPTGPRNCLCLLHIWSPQLLQYLQQWAWGSCSGEGCAATGSAGGDEREEGRKKERDRAVQWAWEAVSGIQHL